MAESTVAQESTPDQTTPPDPAATTAGTEERSNSDAPRGASESSVQQTTTGSDNNTTSVVGNNNVVFQFAEKFSHDFWSRVENLSKTPVVKFDPWVRKKSSYQYSAIGLESKVVQALQDLRKNNFIIFENRLPQLAEDFFELISNSDCFQGLRLEVTSPEEEELSLSGIVSAVKNVAKGSILYIDLHSLKSDTRPALRGQLDSDFDQLALTLQRTGVFCVAASPPSSPAGEARIIGLSFEEEETILVNRASIRGGLVQSIIASKIREQIARALWGEPADRIRRLDDLIRSGRIEPRVDELATEVDHVDADSKKYAAWLQYLIGFADFPDGDRSDRLTRRWSEEVSSALAERALFVLTSFDRLAPTDFDLLMRTLLHGVTIIERVEETEWVAVDEPSEPAGKLKTVNQTLRERTRLVERSISLEDAYSAHPDNLLALLDVRAQESGYLNFEPAFKLQVARLIFRSCRPIQGESLFLKEAIEKSILFDAPIHIAEQLADRFADHASRLALSRQKEFISNWIDRSARHFIEERIPNFKSADDEDAPEIKLLLEAIISREYARDLTRTFAERASLLLSRLLSDQTTRDLVDQALDRLMVEGQDADGKHDLILMFVRILRRHKEFNALRWLKRLLAEGNDDAKRNALNSLASTIESGTEAERASLLEALLLWMPSTDHASILNNQTAALLAPRVAMHRAFARRRDREHGKVDQLVPLFDLNHSDGLVPEFATTMKLLAAPIGGAWIQIDLSLLDQLIESRWGLNELESEDDTVLPAISAIDPTIAAGSWVENDAQQTSLVGLFIEGVAVVLGSPLAASKKRLETMEVALTKLASHLPRNKLYAAYRRAYDFWTVLDEQHSEEAERRALCARWIGDVLYRCHVSRYNG